MTNAERQQWRIDIFQLLDQMDGETETNDNNQVDPQQNDNQSEPDNHRSHTPDIDDAGSEDSDGENEQHTTYVVPKNPVIVQRPDPQDEITETSNAVSKNRPGRPPKQ